MNKKIILVDQIAKINYKYTYSLANELLNKGIDVHLVLDMKENNEVKCPTDNIFLTDEKNISKVKKVMNLFSSYKKIRKIVKKENIDVVHIQWISFSPIEYYLLKRLARKVDIVMTIHDILPFNEKSYDKHFYNKIYKLPKKLILQAEINLKRFGELFPQYKDKAVYIPHGNFLKYADLCDKEVAREKLNIPQDKFVFLFFGQIKKIKGVDILLQSFIKFKENHKDALLIVAGKMWKEEEGIYTDIINNSDLNNETLRWDIKFIPDEEVGYYYSASDVCVLPYTELYQSGVIQLVYAYHKCPIVSNLDPFLEIVDKDTGYSFENGSVDSLLEAMELSYKNKKNNPSLAENGYKKIATKYDWSKIADQIIKECYF